MRAIVHIRDVKLYTEQWSIDEEPAQDEGKVVLYSPPQTIRQRLSAIVQGRRVPRADEVVDAVQDQQRQRRVEQVEAPAREQQRGDVAAEARRSRSHMQCQRKSCLVS